MNVTYDAYFDEVKDILQNQMRGMSEQDLIEYMKSEENIIKEQYEYRKKLFDKGELTLTELKSSASGPAYSLYMLY